MRKCIRAKYSPMNAQRKCLRTGEDRDERSQKRKTGHAATLDEKTCHHISKHQNPKYRKAETEIVGTWSGHTLKPVIKVRAWITRARNV